MGRLNFYTTETNYNTSKNSFDYPTVAYVDETEEVKWMSIQDKYAREYLTFKALEGGTISFNIWRSMGTDMITSISYSTDNGQTWTTTNNTDNKSEHLVIDVNVNQGDKVLWKGIATQTGYYDEDDYGEYVGSFFSSDCEFNAYGNVMSLLYGDNFYSNKNLGNTDGTFTKLFHDYDGEKTCEVVSAQNLMLPATTLQPYCYDYMFYGCTSLTTAPELPATTLANSCYYNMFRGCTALTTAPELPATTLARYCYEYMFNRCTSLTTAPVLSATTLAERCYQGMFSGCTSLTTAPVLPATTLAERCYSNMFDGCTALTTAPELPATTLKESCYYSMFDGCTALTTAPELPATTLAQYCYQYMFRGCTALTTAPELPATTLADGCYNSMFYGCRSLTTAPVLPARTLVSNCYSYMFQNCNTLNYIKAMFTTEPSTRYTKTWVSGVAASGTFVKNSAANWNVTDVTGVNGIPTGWTVETASA